MCGEHGGNAPSIAFFASLACDYLSCSPSRVAVARLAAAQAALTPESRKAYPAPSPSEASKSATPAPASPSDQATVSS